MRGWEEARAGNTKGTGGGQSRLSAVSLLGDAPSPPPRAPSPPRGEKPFPAAAGRSVGQSVGRRRSWENTRISGLDPIGANHSDGRNQQPRPRECTCGRGGTAVPAQGPQDRPLCPQTGLLPSRPGCGPEARPPGHTQDWPPDTPRSHACLPPEAGSLLSLPSVRPQHLPRALAWPARLSCVMRCAGGGGGGGGLETGDRRPVLTAMEPPCAPGAPPVLSDSDTYLAMC